MTDLDKAIEQAREALSASAITDRRYQITDALLDLLSALDAARRKSGNLSETLTSSTPIALPVPAFRLTWRDGQYRVSSPNIGDTDCYTAEQVERLIRYAAPPAAAVPLSFAPDKLAERIAYMRRDFDLSTCQRARFWADECRMIVLAMLAAAERKGGE